MGAFEKGSSVKSSFQAVRHVLGESDWRRVVGTLSPEDQDMVENPAKHHLIPTEVTGRFYTAIHKILCDGDRFATDRLLRSSGRRDADDMLEGIFSVFARFVSPDQAFKRAGGMISAVYVGVTAESLPNATGTGGVLKLHGLEDEPFAVCVISGWIERAIERFGAKNPSVREQNWDAGLNAAPSLVFELAWEK